MSGCMSVQLVGGAVRGNGFRREHRIVGPKTNAERRWLNDRIGTKHL